MADTLQGFRTRDPRTGSLDAEFAAFEAGPANPFQHEQPLLPGNLPAYQPPVSLQNGAASSWAADFQNLHISNQPILSHQFRTEAPLMKSNGWQNEFATHQSNNRSTTAQGKQAIQLPNQNQYVASDWRSGQYTFGDGYMGMAPTPYSYGRQQQVQEQQQSYQPAEPVYDEAAFADAFEQASQHAEAMVTERPEVDRTLQQDGSDLLHKDAIPTDPAFGQEFPSLTRSPDSTPIRIGSDAIPYQDQKTRTPDQDNRDADELARTAGQLLSSVQHDTSDKFQNSQFLALMRKIRDGEVRVEGEEFKETHGSEKMVSNLISSVVRRVKKNQISLPPPMPIAIVIGHKEAKVVFPTHSHNGEVLDYSHPNHRKYVADLFEIAMRRFSSGDYLAQYAPGLFLSLVNHQECTLSTSKRQTVTVSAYQGRHQNS